MVNAALATDSVAACPAPIPKAAQPTTSAKATSLRRSVTTAVIAPAAASLTSVQLTSSSPRWFQPSAVCTELMLAMVATVIQPR